MIDYSKEETIYHQFQGSEKEFVLSQTYFSGNQGVEE